MKKFEWVKGNRDTGYQKMLLIDAKWPLLWDMWILRYPLGSEILPHTDPVKEGQHYRLNFVLKQARIGGLFQCTNPIFISKFLSLFRSDICSHSVTKIEKGSRYVLSLGWVRQ